uniref:CRISPR-associated endoribonuclease n=1 Tax=candidate division WOR-3 bacterium TaxID=2052148 RepID=A0A7C2K3H2_UNCW3
MRLKVFFRGVNSVVVLPIHYNSLVQAFIYKNLDEWLATKLHDEGFKDPTSKRSIKFFTFSRLISINNRIKIREKHAIFHGEICLVVASPYNEFIQSFGSNLLKKNKFEIGNEIFELVSIEVEPTPEYAEKVLVKTISPITVYSTVLTLDGKKKIYYYSPFEEDFEKLLLKNLQRKARIWFGKDIYGGSIKPFKVTKKDEKILLHHGNLVKGWDGIFELSLPPELFQLAFEAGLGAKNSSGFGCIEIFGRNNLKKKVLS